MPFKINISDKGKTFKLEADTEYLVGKKIGEKIEGKELKKELEGYELEITGTSDKAGFPGKKDVEGVALKAVLLKKGWGMKKRPRKEGKKVRRLQKGLKLKKTVRGNTISRDTIQINMKIIKQGGKKLEEIFPKTEKAEGEENKEQKPEEKKEESKPEQQAEEKKPKQPTEEGKVEIKEKPEKEGKKEKAKSQENKREKNKSEKSKEEEK